MIRPLVLFAAVSTIAFVLQVVVPRHRVLLATVTTLLPVAVLFSTVWWRIWERDALWIIGFAMVILESAAASVLGAVAAGYAARSQRL